MLDGPGIGHVDLRSRTRQHYLFTRTTSYAPATQQATVGILEIRKSPGKFRGFLVSMIGSACGIRTRDLRLESAMPPILFYMARYVFRTSSPAHSGDFVPGVVSGVARC